MSELDYPYIRAWCRMTAAYAYFTRMQLDHARRRRAPRDSIYRDTSGKWRRFSEVADPDVRHIINKLVENMK